MSMFEYMDLSQINDPNQCENNAEKKIQCDRCLKRFKTKYYMEHHRSKVHYKEFPSHCARCHMGYFNEQETQKHEASCTKTVFNCDECDHFAVDNSRLDAHKRTHTHEKPFECPVENCQSRYKQKSSLNRHIKTHQK